MALPTLFRGPVLTPGDVAVHIIFVPDGIGAGQRGPDGLPSEQQLDEATTYVREATTAIGTLEQRDVIVFAGLPWHYAGLRLRDHAEAHRDFPLTFLKLAVEREKAVWWSEVDFHITRIEPETGHPAVPFPANGAREPFPTPPTGLEHENVQGSVTQIHVARSLPPVKEAKDCEYKISFKRNEGAEIDPNLRCH